jgi:outer membrane protein OmpA-like peptidoglycan-associated protein
MKTIKIAAYFLLSFSLVFASCNWTRTARGGAIGAGAGGAAGGAIGRAAGNTAAGVIIGAAVGGSVGAAIGRYMDRQAEELQRDLEGAKVERVGEGIHITFDTGILFDFNGTDLRSAARDNIENLAETLKKYEDTEILIQGHTDNVGARDVNKQISEQRARAVADYLTSQNVRRNRLNIEGHGFDMPVSSNETAEGRQENRRVEIAIVANDKLKKAAEKGDL